MQDFVENYKGGLILTSFITGEIVQNKAYKYLNTISPIQFGGTYDSFSGSSLQISSSPPIQYQAVVQGNCF